MVQTVRMVVSTPRSRQSDRWLRAAVHSAGGRLVRVDDADSADGAPDQILTVRIGDERLIHGVVRALDNLPGVAVQKLLEPDAQSRENE